MHVYDFDRPTICDSKFESNFCWSPRPLLALKWLKLFSFRFNPISYCTLVAFRKMWSLSRKLTPSTRNLSSEIAVGKFQVYIFRRTIIHFYSKTKQKSAVSRRIHSLFMSVFVRITFCLDENGDFNAHTLTAHILFCRSFLWLWFESKQKNISRRQIAIRWYHERIYFVNLFF